MNWDVLRCIKDVFSDPPGWSHFFFKPRYEESTESPLLVETVTPQHIAEVVARWTGIPVSKLTQGEKAEIPRWGPGKGGGLPWVTLW